MTGYASSASVTRHPMTVSLFHHVQTLTATGSISLHR
jgi:hypothetical protein